MKYKVLFTTDFSKASLQSFQYLLSLVDSKSILVDIAHVYHVPIASLNTLPPEAVTITINQYKADSMAQLQALRNQLPESNRGSLHSIYGNFPGNDILSRAQKIEADLIAIGLRADYSRSNKWMGSTAAHITSRATCPVLVIPAEAKYNSISTIIHSTLAKHQLAISTVEHQLLKQLKNFAQVIEAEVALINIENSEYLDLHHYEDQQDSFKFIKHFAETLEEGLSHFESDQVLISFFQKDRGFWSRMFHLSNIQSMLYKTEHPLIILPEASL